jgi:dTDP-4-dehydrorhamnose 3,5-epimerase
MSEFYSPDHARGVRWNDPLFRIMWPEDNRILSTKDQRYADCDPARFRLDVAAQESLFP